MKIKSLKIQNFKAIKSLSLENLGSVVIVAGPNGCGKSCIFDAIRLLKSYYGGYQSPNEWQNFYSEQNIDLKNPLDLGRIFNNSEANLEISAVLTFDDREKGYIRENCRDALYKKLWRQHIGRYEEITLNISNLPKEQQDRYQAVKDASEENAQKIIKDLEKEEYLAFISIDSDYKMKYIPSDLLQYVFSTFDPQNIGIIDYHGPNRNYARENVGGIQIRVQDTADRFAQHALYNYANKYSNIKSEMASALVRDLLVREADPEKTHQPSIITTLQELFHIFIPGKSFLGPKPTDDGKISFPVVLSNGREHDIDDLSSGEKELVYGYLRLRNESPSNSIILLDEPELHLNPRLVQGLPDFYRRNLGQSLNNQLWMVTHSDAFLRDAFKSGGFSLFHMAPPEKSDSTGNQVSLISAEDEVQRSIVELVGDLAAYRPDSKLVIFESSEESKFDSEMTMLLFPEIRELITPIPGESRERVEKLFSALQGVVGALDRRLKLYAIVDRDSEFGIKRKLGDRCLEWDRYHIENYLLEPEYIKKALEGFPLSAPQMNIEDIYEGLRTCATDSVGDLIEHELRVYVDRTIKNKLDLGFCKSITSPATGLSQALSRILKNLSQCQSKELTDENLCAKENELKRHYEAALASDDWKRCFRGRQILRLFSGRFLRSLKYEFFRDSIIDKMRNDRFQPLGMKEVLDKIIHGK